MQGQTSERTCWSAGNEGIPLKEPNSGFFGVMPFLIPGIAQLRLPAPWRGPWSRPHVLLGWLA